MVGRWQHATRLMWGGFFGLCAQWGLMMRLTWYEYSWDVMEPISYFISFGTVSGRPRLGPRAAHRVWYAIMEPRVPAGTGILGYMFYVITRKDYTFENLGGTTTNRRQRLEYRKRGLDLDKYRFLSRSCSPTAARSSLTNPFFIAGLVVARMRCLSVCGHRYVRLQTAINGIESQLDAIKRDYAAKP